MYHRCMSLTHKTYNLSVAAKIILGILEVMLAVTVFTIDSQDVAQFLAWLQRGGHTTIYHLAGYASTALAAGKLITVLYLLAHGLPKILIGIALWRRKLWAYPLALSTLAAFMLYQIYLVGYEHSWFMVGLTAVDGAIAWVIFKEFSFNKSKLPEIGDKQAI